MNSWKLSEFYLETPQVIEFFFEKKEKKVLNDYFKRYGSDQYGLMKIFQLLGGSSPMRKTKMSYENYNQTSQTFIKGASILDVLFNLCDKSHYYIKNNFFVK